MSDYKDYQAPERGAAMRTKIITVLLIVMNPQFMAVYTVRSCKVEAALKLHKSPGCFVAYRIWIRSVECI